MRGRGRPRQAGASVPCVFSAKKFGPPLEMSAGYGRVWSCLQLPRFFANATQIFLYRASGRCKQRYMGSAFRHAKHTVPEGHLDKGRRFSFSAGC